MTATNSPARPFVPGTTGWTEADIDAPRNQRHWVRDRFEIVEGVLATMPPGLWCEGEATVNLAHAVTDCAVTAGRNARLGVGVEMVLSRRRVVHVDAAMMLPGDFLRQASAASLRGKPSASHARLYVPPTLVIESISPGYENHDREVKRAWYAEFGVPHYWLVDSHRQTLECLRLDARAYSIDAMGSVTDVVRSSLFDGLKIDLAEIWGGES